MNVRLRGIALMLWALGAAGCSAERKLSHVDAREPSAVSQHKERQISSLRSRLSQTANLSRACPGEFRELLPVLAQERVKFTECPGSLPSAFSMARESLSLEESSAVEELLNVQCRFSPREGLAEPLQQLLSDSQRTQRHVGKGSELTVVAEPEAPSQSRMALKASLHEMKAAADPVENWIRTYGEWVMPEDQLEYFDRLAGEDACRIPDQEVDNSYRSLRALEELARIEPAQEPQRKRIEAFLRGVYKMIDRKIQEFFRR